MLSRITEAKLAVEDDYKATGAKSNEDGQVTDAKAEAKEASQASEDARDEFLDDLSDYLMDALNGDIYNFCEQNCGLFTSDAKEEQSLGCHDVFLQYEHKLETLIAGFLKSRGISNIAVFMEMVKQAESLKSEKADSVINMVLGAADYDTFAVMMVTAHKRKDAGDRAWTWL
jgi:hypothetical protein